MSPITYISVRVREALGTLVRSQRRGTSVTMSDAIARIRKQFPGLRVTDNVLISGILAEAVAAGVAIKSDPFREVVTSTVDVWDNEGGAPRR